MHIYEVRSLNDSELHKALSDQEQGLMNLRFRTATLQLKDVSQIKQTRRTIARIKTVIRERQIAGRS